MKKLFAMVATVAVSASLLSLVGASSSEAAPISGGVVNQDVMSPSKYIAKGTFATTNPQGAPVSQYSNQTAQLVNTLPDRYLNDFWKGRLKTSTNRENFTIPIYTVDSSKANTNWVSVKMRDTAYYKDIHPILEGKATASDTGGTYGFVTTPLATNAKNYGKVPIPAHAVPGGPNPGGDKAFTVVDIATGLVRGYYVAEKQANGSWLMGGGYVTTLDNPTSTNWFDKNYWMKTERGTSSVGGVMNEFLMAGAQEIADGSINHVTSWTFPSTKANDAMWPAFQSDGKLGEAQAPKMGQRFWIPNDAATNAKLAKMNLTSFEKVVVKNLQEYGGIVTDQNFWTMALNLQHPVQYTSQGKPNPYTPGGIVHAKHGNVDLINGMPWELTKWGDIKETTILPQQVAKPTTPVVTPPPVVVPKPTPVVTPKPTPKPNNYGVGSRIEGADRYATAINVSKKYNTVGKPLFITTGDGTVDTLIAAPAASKTGASMLITPTNSLPANLSTEIKRLKPSQIYIVGGVSSSVETALKKLVKKVERINGNSRSETSVLVANKFFPGANGMFMANVTNGNNSINASSRAAMTKVPVLLTEAKGPSASMTKYIQSKSTSKKTVKIVGNTDAVSAAIATSVSKTANVQRVVGTSHYETNAKVVQDYLNSKPAIKGFTITTGTSYNDALVGVMAAAKSGQPLVVAPKDCVVKSSRTILAKYPNATNVLVGKTTLLASNMYQKTCTY